MAFTLARMPSLELPVSPTLERCSSLEAFKVNVYLGTLSPSTDFIPIDAVKNSPSEEIVKGAVLKLHLGHYDNYELAETFCSGGQICKERRLESNECPVKIQILWPQVSPYIAERHRTEYRFFLCKKEPDRLTGMWMEYSEPTPIDSFLTTFLQQSSKKKEYTDLCNLPNLNESTLLENLRRRFNDGNIYTYVGSILISLNPFKFYPIYNPKYVKMYQNHGLGELPPHIFAIADAAYYTMLHEKKNQCIVISGESGSGKTESTNLLLHHLSALSQKGYYSNGIEQTILGAGPVLEAFGNAKTVHNNNSSRFGKFIQVNYKENGVVHGAVLEKYLLEKSRIVSQSKLERNYHVFYYLLAGANENEREMLGLCEPQEYFYLNQSECYTLENLDGECVDEAFELTRLKQSMEMVGFTTDIQRRIFSVLAAVLQLGNVCFKKKTDHTHHEAVQVQSIDLVNAISGLLKVKQATMLEALTKKKTMAGGEAVVMNYKMTDAVATRDAMAKCLYGALFDWIVLQINHAILAKRDYKEHQGYSIGVLDIFGFEDFDKNSFEQFCINYANEHLHYYFNQHIFKFEQEEYMREGIQWKNIEFMDNTGCLDLFSSRPTGLLYLLDEECNFPGASNETLLAKFHSQHSSNPYYEEPQMKQSAFTINHYAGKVKYQIQDFREKNSDLMRHDVVLLLKNSSLAFVREIVGYDPVAVMRWAILRAFFRAYFAFKNAGRQHQRKANGIGKGNMTSSSNRQTELRSPSNSMSRLGSVKKLKARWDQNVPDDTGVVGDVSNLFKVTLAFSLIRRIQKNRSFRPKTRTTKLKDLKVLKTLAGKRTLGPRPSKGKNKPPSVNAQFNFSLQQLMDTLGQANPFFIRCIKSNMEKAPCVFDNDIVMRQLRYTGMLATVKIRQSGYNYRLTTEEFLHQYKVLLPKGLFSSKQDIHAFLVQCDQNEENFQIGKTKVFLRETDKLILDEMLHCAIMQRIMSIQTWLRTRLERRRFLRMRSACIVIQSSVRMFLVRRHVQLMRQMYATVLIQRMFRGFRDKKAFREQKQAALVIQKHIRGHLGRKEFAAIKTTSVDSLPKVEIEEEDSSASSLTNKLPRSLSTPPLAKFRQKSGSDITDGSSQGCHRSHRQSLGLKIPPREPIKCDNKNRLDIHGRMRDRSRSENDARSNVKALPVIGQKTSRVENRIRTSDEDLRISGDRMRRFSDRMRTSEEKRFQDRISEDKFRNEIHDLHSSASDEGILSKELSSEEYLSEKTETDVAKGLESEESSGILDDSESEATHYSSQAMLPKPRTRSVASLPSTMPGSMFTTSPPSITSTPSGNRVPSEPFEDIIDFQYPSCLLRSSSRQVPEKPRAHSVAVLQGAAQQRGPRDLEIRVGPVTKSSLSEEFLQTYESSSYRISTLPNPHIAAPLARPEPFSEFEDSLLISNPGLKKKQTSMSSLMTSDGMSLSSQTGISNKSPFHKARKQLKQFVTGGKKKRENIADDSDDSQVDDIHSITSELSGTIKVKETWADDESTTTKPTKLRRRNSKKKRAHKEKVKELKVESWTVSSTSQWQYPTDKVISNFVELQQLEVFVFNKLLKLQQGGQRETIFDHVFKRALKEFQNNLIIQISIGRQQHMSYHDIMVSFEKILKAHTMAERTDDEFPVTIGINAFRGFLDEFNKRKENRELPEIKVKKEKKKKDKETYVEHNGHRYEQALFSIHTYCELCSSHIWLLEKAFVCQVCRYTVHKKCYSKSSTKCSWFRGGDANGVGDKIFGVPLHALVSPVLSIPPIMDRLFSNLELNWIYTEGLYRKGGASVKIRDLIKDINADPDNAELSAYHVHVLTSVVKRFLYDLPDPLLTYDSYGDIIMATEITDERERVRYLYSIIEKLPQCHHDLFERLIFHLAKVAINEEYNKMSATGLAIIFAPSILKTNRPQTAQDSLNVVSKTSLCIQTIIEEQMRKLRHGLDDIQTLDTAAASATSRLLRVRASIQAHDQGLIEATVKNETICEQDEEQMLSEQIALWHHRKATLTNQLTVFDSQCWSSSEEDLLSTEELDAPKDERNFEEYAVSFDYPASPSKQLKHMNKRRAPLPRRQIPTPIKKMNRRRRALDSGSDDEDDCVIPQRQSLVAPQLSTIGSEIIV